MATHLELTEHRSPFEKLMLASTWPPLTTPPPSQESRPRLVVSRFRLLRQHKKLPECSLLSQLQQINSRNHQLREGRRLRFVGPSSYICDFRKTAQLFFR